MKLSDYKNITKFLKDNTDCGFEVSEIGFGRPCVGILNKGHFLAYQITSDDGDYETIAKSSVALNNSPENAYHKDTYLAVLMYPEDDDIGPSDNDKAKAIRQLDGWLGAIIKGGYKIQEYMESANSLGALMGKRQMLKAIVDNE